MNKYKSWMIVGLIYILLSISTAFATQENFIETIYDAVTNGTALRSFTSFNIDLASPAVEVKKPVYDPVGVTEAMVDLHELLNEQPQPVVVTKDPNWWQYLNPLPPPNSTPEQIHAFAKNFPAEASILMLKNIYGIEIEGGMLGSGSAEAGDLWTPEQLYYTLWAVHEMPQPFTKYTKYIKRVQKLAAAPTAHAYVVRGQPRVYICDRGLRPGGYERTLIHEMAHIWMFDPENKPVMDEFINTFWPNKQVVGTPTTGYAYSNAYEDFAEAVASFWENPTKMKSTSPRRFDFILNKVVGYYRLNPRAMSTNTSLSSGSTPNRTY